MDLLKKLGITSSGEVSTETKETSEANNLASTVQKKEYESLGGRADEAEKRIAPYMDETLEEILKYEKSRDSNPNELRIPKKSKTRVNEINKENKVYLWIFNEIKEMKEEKERIEDTETKYTENNERSRNQTKILADRITDIKTDVNEKDNERIPQGNKIKDELIGFYNDFKIEERLDIIATEANEADLLIEGLKMDAEVIGLKHQSKVELTTRIEKVYSEKLKILEDIAKNFARYVGQTETAIGLWNLVDVHEDIIQISGKDDMDSVFKSINLESLNEESKRINDLVQAYQKYENSEKIVSQTKENLRKEHQKESEDLQGTIKDLSN